MRNNKTYKLLFVFITIIFLCGCWDIKDINKRSLPLVMGISINDNQKYELTLQTPVPKDYEQVSTIVTEEGESIASALSKIRTNSENAVDLSQIQLIIIQDKLAQNSLRLKELTKLLVGSEEIPSRALVALTDDNIQKVLSNINDKLGVNATALYDYFNKGFGWAPEIFSIPIWELYKSPFLYTKDIAVPVIQSGKDTVLDFKGAEILSKGQPVARIRPEESQFIKVFQNKDEKGKIESLNYATIIVTNSSVRNKTKMENNIPVVSSDLNFTIHILEKKEDTTTDEIKEEFEKITEKRFYSMLKKSKKNHSDIFGFGQQFQDLLSYDQLKNWRYEYYPKLKVNFKVHVRID